MVLEGAGFCVSQDESKSEIHFKDGSLICKDAAELFAET